MYYDHDQLKAKFKHCTKVTIEEFYTEVYTKNEDTGEWVNEEGTPYVKLGSMYFEKYVQMREDEGHIVTLEFAHHDKLRSLKHDLVSLFRNHGVVPSHLLKERERLENEISALEYSGIVNKCNQCGNEEPGVDFGVKLLNYNMYCQDCGENIPGWC